MIKRLSSNDFDDFTLKMDGYVVVLFTNIDDIPKEAIYWLWIPPQGAKKAIYNLANNQRREYPIGIYYNGSNFALVDSFQGAEQVINEHQHDLIKQYEPGGPKFQEALQLANATIN